MSDAFINARLYLDEVCKALINKDRFIVKKDFQIFLEKTDIMK